MVAHWPIICYLGMPKSLMMYVFEHASAPPNTVWENNHATMGFDKEESGKEAFLRIAKQQGAREDPWAIPPL